jgi:hypothetical protein
MNDLSSMEQVANLVQICPETVARRARKKQLRTVPSMPCHRLGRDGILRGQDMLRGPR